MDKPRKTRNFFKMTMNVVFVAVVVITVALFWFSFYIADYEATQPKHVVNAVMDQYFTAPDYELWALEAITGYLSEFESAEDYRRYIREIFAGDDIATRSPQATFTGAQREYTVYSGDTPFAKFTVAKTMQKSRFGFPLWGLQSIGPVPSTFASRVSVHAQVLRGSTLYINGIAVDERFLVGEGEPFDAAAHLPAGVTDPVYDFYTVNHLFYEPVVSTTDRFGKTAVLTQEEAMYREELRFSPLPEDLGTFAQEALLAYCRFSNNGSNLNAVGRYCDRTSPVWADVLGLSAWLWAYPSLSGYDYQGVSIGDYYPYNDDAFSVRAKMTQILMRSNESLTYPIDFTMYFVRQANGSFLLYSLVSHV